MIPQLLLGAAFVANVLTAKSGPKNKSIVDEIGDAFTKKMAALQARRDEAKRKQRELEAAISALHGAHISLDLQRKALEVKKLEMEIALAERRLLEERPR